MTAVRARSSLPRRGWSLRWACVLSALSLLLSACSGGPGQADREQPSQSGSDSRQRPHRLFAADSFWYQRLPGNAPIAANSARAIARIMRTGGGAADGAPPMTINTHAYTPPLVVARNSDPTVTFRWTNCGGLPDDGGLIAHHLSRLHVPADARPAKGTDAEMSIYNVDTGQYTDTWQTARDGSGWSACWGGTIPDAARSEGVFPAPFGTTASGLALEPGTIKAEELEQGHIDHVVGVILPMGAIDNRVSRPATRTDGTATGDDTVSEGQLLRLPPDLDLDSLELSPVAATLARAAQEYGLIVWDRSDRVTFRAENATGLRVDPYPALLQGRNAAEALRGDTGSGQQAFPFDRLQVIERDYINRG